MKTNHKILFGNSNNMEKIGTETIDLVVTSPPYPMIEMWDEMFSEQNNQIKNVIKKNNGLLSFELMHQELDKVWKECYRVIKNGGFACINIGDATRTLGKDFQLYSNHSRIINYCHKIGFQVMPSIIWRKQTNKPNKFMGSGMLPAGAYVTLEHEYVIILRKGGKREFNKKEDKINRRKSSYFFEERNNWFSDIWTDIKGLKQGLNHKELRDRSAAYPFEFVYRLINMYSAQGDTVLDPFLGTGTTTIATMASARNSIGFEIDKNFLEVINDRIINLKKDANKFNIERIENHKKFINEWQEKNNKQAKYNNINYDFSVITRQEKEIKLPIIKSIETNNSDYFVFYED